MNQRLQTADLLKGIAILFMIQVHILELFANADVVNTKIGSVLLLAGGPTVAPIFMIIFGYFISASSKSTKQLFLRGLKIFVAGMILNILLNLNLIITAYKGLLQINVWHYIFGVDILHFAGISLMLLSLLKKLLKKHIITILIGILISLFLGPYLKEYFPENDDFNYFTAFLYGGAQWSYFPLFPWITYPLVGFCFLKLQQDYNYNFVFSFKTKFLMGVVFFLFFVLTLRYAISITANLSSYYHHDSLFFSWVIVFLSFYTFFIHQVDLLLRDNFVANYIKWLGKNVTYIYIVQWIIIGNVATEIYQSINSRLFLFAAFVIVLATSSFLTWTALKIKLDSKLNLN